MQENDYKESRVDESLSGETNNPHLQQNETEDIDGNAGTDEVIKKLQSELEEQKDKYIRLFAEFDNYKRRTSKEAIELRQTAGKEVIISMLDVLDDMDRSEDLMKDNIDEKAVKEGTLLIFNKFRKILQSRGLKALETLHSEFDVEKDEAVSEIHVDDKKLKGKVVAELQKGYFLNDKLIRFAKVVVGK